MNGLPAKRRLLSALSPFGATLVTRSRRSFCSNSIVGLADRAHSFAQRFAELIGSWEVQLARTFLKRRVIACRQGRDFPNDETQLMMDAAQQLTSLIECILITSV